MTTDWHGTWVAAAATLAALWIGGCESESSETSSNSSRANAPEPADGPKTFELRAVGDRFRYDRTKLRVKPDQKVTVKLTNPSKRETIKHNYVQLDTDSAATAMNVAKAGWKATDSDYVPDHDAVLASTSVAGPGETVQVTFSAPERAGRYLFLCTYPGHYPPMDGLLIVRESD